MKITVSIVMDDSMQEELSMLARKNGCSTSAMFRRIMFEWRENVETKPRLSDKKTRG